ncbi:DUF11 domain-containing protein [Candidatus Roizmanbacteria bacterium]|nr:DUF11 domain-containing protein [Candidatus Roizmanbacteria bacterium]
MKKSLVGVTTFFLLLFTAVSASAQQYGPYQAPAAPSILVEKMVGKPTITKGGVTTSDFVDNLSPSDPRFRSEQEVDFRVSVKNPTDTMLNNVVVKDFLPDFVTVLEGPGSFDASSKTITVSVGTLAPQEEKVFLIKAKVVSQNQLPADQSIVCVVNRVTAQANGASDEDTAQFCIEKEVVGAQEVPAAGPELGLALLAVNAAALAAGLYLRKRA